MALRQTLAATLSTQGVEQANAQLDQWAADPSFQLPQQLLELLRLPLGHDGQHEYSEDLAESKGVRIAGAIFLKNIVRKGWAAALAQEDLAESTGQPSVSSGEEGSSTPALPPLARETIKTQVVDLMLSLWLSERVVAKQLAEILSIIGELEFPTMWSEVLPLLVQKMSSTSDSVLLNGVLASIHALTKRYRLVSQSPEVVHELGFILETLQEPLLQCWSQLVDRIQSALSGDVSSVDTQATGDLLRAAKHIANIFFSLNSLTIPEYFEDHIVPWFTGFKTVLALGATFENLVAQFPGLAQHPHVAAVQAAVGEDGDDKPAALQKAQRVALDCVRLYAEKYEDEFKDVLPDFVQTCWNLLLQTHAKVGGTQQAADTVEDEPRFDGLVSAGLSMLTTVATSVFWELFAQEGVLSSIITNIVLPNLRLREIDIELFEDNPVDYIRADIEGSDTGTRRRAATELVKGLRKHYEHQVTEECASHANHLLELYGSDAQTQWAHKDVAIYLVTALAARATTVEKGATQVNELVPLAEFFQSQILPELQAAQSAAAQSQAPESGCASPVLLADALKFVTAFRTQFDKQQVVTLIFPTLFACLQSETYVIHTYAANALEKFLILKDEVVDDERTEARYAQLRSRGASTDDVPPFVVRVNRFGGGDIRDFLNDIISTLLRLLAGRPQENNEYIAKCLLRVLAAADQHDIVPYCTALNETLVSVLTRVCSNPANPTFNHFLFESVAVLIRVSGQQSVASQTDLLSPLQDQLLPVFEIVLSQDLQDLSPYAFQLLAQLMELQVSSQLSQIHVTLLPLVLQPHLWERAGSIPALVRLLRAYAKRGGEMLIQPTPGSADAGGSVTPLMGMLGVFQKLVMTKLHDHEGFYILEAIVEHLPIDYFADYLGQIFTLIFTRLSNPKMKTDKFIRSFLLWLCLFIGKHGADQVAERVSALQQGLFDQLLSSVWVPHVRTINGKIERKMAAIALSKLLFESDVLIERRAQIQPIILPLVQALVEILANPLAAPEPESVSASSDGRRAGSGSSRFASASSSLLAAANAAAQLAEESDIEAPRSSDMVASTYGTSGFHAFTAGFGGNAFARLVFAETESPDPFVATDPHQFATSLIQSCAARIGQGELANILSSAAGEAGLALLSA